MKQYPDSLKQDLVRKLMSPHGPNATELAEQTQVSQATLSRWLRALAETAALLCPPLPHITLERLRERVEQAMKK